MSGLLTSPPYMPHASLAFAALVAARDVAVYAPESDTACLACEWLMKEVALKLNSLDYTQVGACPLHALTR